MDKQDKQVDPKLKWAIDTITTMKESSDVITAKQAKQLVDTLVSLTTKQKEELVNKNEDFLSSVSQETFKQIQNALIEIREKANTNQLEVRQLSNKNKKDFETAIARANDLIVELQSIEIPEPEEVDRESIIQETLSRIPEAPEIEEESADSIASKLNTLEEVVDQKVIKGLTKKISDLSSNIAHNAVKDGAKLYTGTSETRVIELIGKHSTTTTGSGAVDSVNGQTGVVVLDTDDISDTATSRYTNDTDITRLANTSGTNTGDQDLSSYAKLTDIAQDITANSFITDGGTSSQFVKGDGSLDSSTYLTSVGTGTTNELTYWSGSNTLGSLSTSTYPSLTELSYVKGVTSSIQDQLDAISSVSFGTVGQIPFMNAGGTDFDYSAEITWDGTYFNIDNSTVNQPTMRVNTGGGTANAISVYTSSFGTLIGGIGLASNIASNAFQLSATNRAIVLHNNGVGGIVLNSGAQITIQGSSGVVVNEDGADDDFRVESDIDTDAFFLDGANSEITIGGYGAGSITGTATYALAVDSTGKVIEVALGGGSGATTALDNLASVAINTSLISDTNNTDDLGSTGIRWKKTWTVDLESTNMPTVGGTSLSSTFSPIAGSASITTVGTIGTGTWQGTAIGDTYISNTLTGKSVNGVTLVTGGTATKYLSEDGTYTTPATGLTWSVVTGTTQAAAVNKGYFTNNAAQVVVTLPATFAVGDTFKICGMGAGGWKLAQNASQLIVFTSGGVAGLNQTTTGTGGFIASSDSEDAIELVASVANTTLRVVSLKGNIVID